MRSFTFILLLALPSFTVSQLPQAADGPIVPFSSVLPACASNCGPLYDVQAKCGPPNLLTVSAPCFCTDSRLTPFDDAGTTGVSQVCIGVGSCTSATDLQIIKSWYDAYCAANGITHTSAGFSFITASYFTTTISGVATTVLQEILETVDGSSTNPSISTSSTASSSSGSAASSHSASLGAAGNGGLSAGAKAGIGIGAAIGVITLLLLGYLFGCHHQGVRKRIRGEISGRPGVPELSNHGLHEIPQLETKERPGELPG